MTGPRLVILTANAMRRNSGESANIAKALTTMSMNRFMMYDI